jgi:hypothetical protein
MASIFPKQKISYADKIKRPEISSSNLTSSGTFVRSKTWGELCVDWFCDLATGLGKDKQDLRALYRLADNDLETSNYEYILNPYNTTNERYKKWPAKLRNYPIITPLIDLLLGEIIDYHINPIVTTGAKDVENEVKKELNKVVEGILYQQFINSLIAAGTIQGEEPVEMPPIEEVIKTYLQNPDEARAKYGQQAIDYIVNDQDLYDKWQRCAEHWFTVGRYYTYRDARNDDVVFDVLHPLDCYHPLDPQTPFVEDLPWFVLRRRRHRNQIIDDYHRYLTPEQIDQIEIKTSSYITDGSKPMTVATQTLSSTDLQAQPVISAEYLDVYHCTWKSFQKVGILTYINPDTGKEEELEVDETYKLNKAAGDVKVTWEWVNQVWEGTKIYLGGVAEDIYINIRPTLVQHDELSDRSACKLPFGGRIQLKTDGSVKSFAKKGEPFQQLYNALHFSFEKTIHKNKDKLTTMPLGLIPNKPGWDMDKFMYLGDALGWVFFDETKPNAAAVLSALRAIDLSLYQYIEGMWAILKNVKEEWWDTVGMNRQRFGDIMASDGKGTSQQALVRSSIVTAEEIRKFQKGQERDLVALLNVSKLAWVNGKKGAYNLSDGARAYIDIDPYIHTITEYNVFCKLGLSEYNKLQEAKALLQPAMQNGYKLSMSLDVLDSTNLSKIKEIAKKAEELQQKYEEAAAEAERIAKAELDENVNAREEAKAALEKYKADLKAETDVTVAEIQAEATLSNFSPSGDDTGDDAAQKIEDRLHKFKMDRDKFNLDLQKFSFDKHKFSKEYALKVKNSNKPKSN